MKLSIFLTETIIFSFFLKIQLRMSNSAPASTEIPNLIPKEKLPDKITHELQSSWTFYYLIPDKFGTRSKNWKDFLKQLHSFNTFEDFWGIINSIEEPSRLQKGCRYYIFRMKKGQNQKELVPIQPLWEDVNNTGGYEISVQYSLPQNHDQNSRSKNGKFQQKDHNFAVNKMAQENWIMMTAKLLCANPQYFKHHESINGVEFNCRGNAIKVGIWTSHTISDGALEETKRNFLNILGYNENDKTQEFKFEKIILEEEKLAILKQKERETNQKQ